MLKRVFAAFFFLCGCFAPALAVLRLAAQSGAAVEVTARALQPGEALLAVFLPSSEGQAAEAVFLGKNYIFTPGGPGGKAFALMGIDLMTDPGSYKFEVRFTGRSGSVENVQEFIRVHPKAFSRKNFNLDPSLVDAPPELQDRLLRERQILSRVYRDSGSDWLGQGNFHLPHSGELTPNFGEQRLYNRVPRSRHTGVDISTDMGSDIRASNSGRVALAMDLYYSGNTVILDHGLGVFTVYCHCSRLDVREGGTVRRSEVIAAAGSTGRSTGPHLHWSVRIQGSRVDPLSLLRLELE